MSAGAGTGAMGVLSAFQRWRQEHFSDNDGAHLLTGADLSGTDGMSSAGASDGGGGAVGLGYVGSVCTGWAVAAVQYANDAVSIALMAHQLAHNFGVVDLQGEISEGGGGEEATKEANAVCSSGTSRCSVTATKRWASSDLPPRWRSSLSPNDVAPVSIQVDPCGAASP